jgi:hypothetical protein
VQIQPSATSSQLLRGAVLALKAVDKPIRKEIAKETRETMNPAWRDAVATHAAGSRFDNVALGKGARVAAGNPARLVAASSKRALRKGENGFVPNVMGRALEFPGNVQPSKKSTYVRRYKGGGEAHDVKRRTMTGYPAPKQGGRVVYPAVADVMPRFVSLWVQIIVRNIYKSMEGK